MEQIGNADGMTERSREAVLLLAHVLLDTGKYSAAAKILAGLLSLNASDMEAARGMLHALLHLGRYEEAERLSADLVRRETGRGRAAVRFCRAHALWGCGRLEECRREVDRYAAIVAEERGREQKHS